MRAGCMGELRVFGVGVGDEEITKKRRSEQDAIKKQMSELRASEEEDKKAMEELQRRIQARKTRQELHDPKPNTNNAFCWGDEVLDHDQTTPPAGYFTRCFARNNARVFAGAYM